MFSIVWAQLENSSFSEHFPVVDSASVAFSKARNSDIIQPISCEL